MSISTVTSESLQLKLRQLLPSQTGFGTDISASDTIIPIIDLTQAAQGSDVPEFLQTAWDSTTGHNTISTSTTTTLINNTGFWKVDLNLTSDQGNSTRNANIIIDDGTTQTVIWEYNQANTSAAGVRVQGNDTFYVFLRAGDILKSVTSFGSNFFFDIWYRQVADINGTLVNPTGFSPS